MGTDKCCFSLKRFFVSNARIIATILGVIMGFVIGFILRFTNPSEEALLWIGMPGDLFIRLLELTILPLIAANVIVVTSCLDSKENKKSSFVAFAFIITSNIIAALSGTAFGIVIKPGVVKPVNLSVENQGLDTKYPPKTMDIFADLLYNLFPNSLVGISIYQSRTIYTGFASYDNGNDTVVVKRVLTNVSSVNMLGLIFCSFLFGIAGGNSGEQGKPFLDFFKSLSVLVFRIMDQFLLLTPIGVCSMIAKPVAAITNLGNTFSQLSLFVATVIAGLATHIAIMLIIYTVATRRNPFALLPYCFKPWLIAFTTLAPLIAIPEMYISSDRLGVKPKLSRFVAPLSAALKGDGAAVFISASAIFITQLTETPVTSGMIVIICLLSASAVFAIPNVPSSSILILVTILSSLNVPVNLVGILFAMEWMLDRLRTTNMSVLHMYCVAFTHYLCREEAAPTEIEFDSGDNSTSEKSPAVKIDVDKKSLAEDNEIRSMLIER